MRHFIYTLVQKIRTRFFKKAPLSKDTEEEVASIYYPRPILFVRSEIGGGFGYDDPLVTSRGMTLQRQIPPTVVRSPVIRDPSGEEDEIVLFYGHESRKL